MRKILLITAMFITAYCSGYDFKIEGVHTDETIFDIVE